MVILQILWILLPACVWIIDYAPGWIIARGSRSDLSIAVSCALLAWAILTVISIVRTRSADSAGGPKLLQVLATAGYQLIGAAFLLALGPGIAGNTSGPVRGILGALLITLAWTGWSILHPTTRMAVVGLMRSIGGGGTPSARPPASSAG